MGFSTDFVGHIEIEPPLNDVEMSYLSAFAASRRYDRGDPYDVPGNPCGGRQRCRYRDLQPDASWSAEPVV
jgi:hypothetical protein